MNAFRVGQRVSTTVNAPAGWPGAFSAPTGTLGTITTLPTSGINSYSVLLDGDPDNMPASFDPDEITAAK